MTKWSFEVPTAHLDDFEDLQDFVFTLSFLCKDPTYYRWVKKQASSALKTIWLDNSFNEKGCADIPSELGLTARDIQATRVISPDDPSWSTQQIADSWVATGGWWREDQIITVVKSESMYRHLKSIGATNFAISYHVRRTKSLPDLMWTHNKQIHFLGLCSVNEIKVLKPPSCDTSRPIKLALQGISTEEWIDLNCTTKYHPPGDNKLPYFYLTMSLKEIELARHNILKLKEVCK